MDRLNGNNIKKKIKQTFPWICIGIVGFMFVFFVNYSDQSNTVRQSIAFFNEILKGNFTGGYEAVIDLVGTPGNWDIPAAYEPFTYIIVGAFSLPVVLLYHFQIIGLPVGSYNGIGDMWFTLFVKVQHLVLIGGTAACIYHICNALGREKEEAKNGILYFISGTSFLYYALAIGQMEIYVVFFSTLGILYWIKKEHKKFLLCFAIAIPIKMFALLIFFPLLLIREKRIWKIIIDLLAGCSIWIILKVVFHANDAYRISVAEPNQRMFDSIFANQLPGGNTILSAIPIFLLIYVLICICVFFMNDEKHENFFAIYLPFVVYATLFSFIGHYPYWMVLITPFLPLLMIYDPQKKNGNLLIASIVGICYNMTVVFGHRWAFSSIEDIDTSFVPLLFEKRELSEIAYGEVAQVFHNSFVEKMVPAFTAFYVAGFLWLIIYNLPLKWLKDKMIEVKGQGLIYLRILAIVPFVVLNVATYYSVKDTTIIDTTGGNIMTSGWNLVSKASKEYGKDVLIQEVSFNEAYQINKLKLFFRRSGNIFAAYSSLNVEFVDLVTNEVLYSKRIGYNELSWETFTDFDLKGISVKPKRKYAVRVYPEDAQEAYPIYICFTENDVISESNAEYMGGDSGHDLYMIIEGKNQE